jgi:hypothetical protein
MSVIIEEQIETIPDVGISYGGTDIPPIFGRCPVCGKPLKPRDRYTEEPKAPPIGQGIKSRAKCYGCGSIIEYIGNGNWIDVTGDLLPEQGE